MVSPPLTNFAVSSDHHRFKYRLPLLPAPVAIAEKSGTAAKCFATSASHHRYKRWLPLLPARPPLLQSRVLPLIACCERCPRYKLWSPRLQTRVAGAARAGWVATTANGHGGIFGAMNALLQSWPWRQCLREEQSRRGRVSFFFCT
jgi:hypothetical protein